MDGWMDGWIEWYGFRVQGIHINGEKEKGELVLPSEREMLLYGTLLQRSRRYFWHSRYFWDAGYATRPLGPSRLLLALALFLLGLHLPQDLQLLRDELGRIQSRGAGPGGHQCRDRTRNPEG